MGIADTRISKLPKKKDEFLHYGVKGMRWGVRRTDKQLAAARKERGKNTTTTDPETGEKVSVVTGHSKRGSDGVLEIRRHKTSSDWDQAIDTHLILQEFGPKAVDNKDLNAYMARVDLERRYSKLKSEQDEAAKSRGRKMLDAAVKREMAALKQGKPGPIGSIIRETPGGKKLEKKLPKPVQKRLSELDNKKKKKKD